MLTKLAIRNFKRFEDVQVGCTSLCQCRQADTKDAVQVIDAGKEWS